MNDYSKTKDQLIKELSELRRKLSELEKVESEHKKSQKDLKIYSSLFSQTNDLAYLCDTKGNILYINEAFEKLSGHKPEEFIGKSFAPLFDKENLVIANECYQSTLKGESPKYEIAFKDTKVLCEYKNLPFRDEEGTIQGVVGIARDITNRKRIEDELKRAHKVMEVRVQERTAELALANMGLKEEIKERMRAEELIKESEENFRALVTNTEEIVFIIDKDGIFLLSEGKGLAKLSLGPGQVVGKSVFELYQDYPEMLDEIRKAINGETSHHRGTCWR